MKYAFYDAQIAPRKMSLITDDFMMPQISAHRKKAVS